MKHYVFPKDGIRVKGRPYILDIAKDIPKNKNILCSCCGKALATQLFVIRTQPQYLKLYKCTTECWAYNWSNVPKNKGIVIENWEG
jgi:hypothetical protein